MSLSSQIRARALSLGFTQVGIIPAGPTRTHDFYRSWLEAGFAGEMAYLQRHLAAKSHPENLLAGVQSIIVLSLNYNPPTPVSGSDSGLRGKVSRYALGRDYHEVVGEKLKSLSSAIEELAGHPVATRSAVDALPIMEREFAARAGLGWVGKNGNLIHRQWGSWLFLAELLVDLKLEPDPAPPVQKGFSARNSTATSRSDAPALPPVVLPRVVLPEVVESCGSCTACLDACPTEAIVADKTVDASRCISYLTIELKGPIPKSFRKKLNGWIFGCDICQEVCPWNRKAPPTQEKAFHPAPATPDLPTLLAMDDAGFKNRFRGTPLERAKRKGVLRNAAIELACQLEQALQSGQAQTEHWKKGVAALMAALGDHDALVRGAAAWGLGILGERALLEAALSDESDPVVRDEIKAFLPTS